MPVQCADCGLELPMRPGPLTTCPRCAPESDVAGRIAAELVDAALSRSDGDTRLQLLSTAEAWRAIAQSRARNATSNT